ncbi:MAG: beta-N-acetylglucosaminidase domain-containing protein [Bacteroidales bacterium]|nr:beta-N-acetylglucosaminidase domain-containing protein [Bacteroidales bacterium]
MTKLFFRMLLLALMMAGGKVWAQDAYTIYPIPQQQVKMAGEASFTASVSVVAEEGVDQYTIDRLKQILREHHLTAVMGKKPQAGTAAIYLGINGSGGAADRKAKSLKLKREVFGLAKYDRHVVSISQAKGKAQVVVIGENTDAVFYGLATLEQMLDGGTQKLPCTVIYDYADVQHRGIIEGYYGLPYSEEVTADLFRFMARYKLNTYMYGAKSDPYHSRYWDKAYPKKISAKEKRLGLMTEDMMKHLCEVAHQSKVNFIWSIHPGQTFTELKNSDVLDRIMAKFEKMYSLGVRQFGVFVDDVGVPYDTPTLSKCTERLTDLQQRIGQRWNKPGAAAADTVKPLQYVPQLYAYSWVKRELAQKFWNSLTPVPEKVNIYTTGKNVWSVPNSKDLDVLNGFLGREVAWWWNYPCNDNDVTKIFIADTYTNFADETNIANHERMEKGLKLKTIIINPMQQGELSKVALFSVGDYTWNMNAFDNMASWRASLKAVVGNDRAEALETLVPNLRYYDEQSKLARLIAEFKAAYATEGAKASPQALHAELVRIGEACGVIEAMAKSTTESDTLFYADIKPWLTKLNAMAENADKMLMELTQGGTPAMNRVEFAKCWSAIEGIDKNEAHRFDILTGMGSDITLSVRTAAPSAKVLRPFLDWLLQQFEK